MTDIAKTAHISTPAEKSEFDTVGVITVSAAHGVHDTYSGFLAPLLPILIENLALTKTAAALLSVFYQVPSLIQPVIGHFGDRVNLRMLVVLGPAISAVMMSLMGVAPSYAVLILLMIVAGLSSAGLHAIGPVIAGLLSGKQLGRGMSYWMVAGELARTLSPVLVVAAVTLLTPRGLPWLMIGGIAASVVLYLRLRNVPDYRPPAGEGLPWGEALRRMRPLILPMALVIGTRSLLFAACTIFLPTFLTEEGVAYQLAGSSLSVMQAAAVAGALFFGVISDRLGRRRILIALTLLGPLSVLLFLSVSGSVAVSGWWMVPALLLVGFTLLSTTPVLMALVLGWASEYRSLANGIYMALNFVLISVGTLIVGAIADRYGLRAAITTSVVVMLVGLPAAFFLPRGETKAD